MADNWGAVLSNLRNMTTDGILRNSVNKNGIKNAELLADKGFDESRLFDSLIEKSDEGHLKLLTPKTIGANHNFQMVLERPSQIGEGQLLQEGVTPSGDELTYSTVRGTLRQYGYVIYSTDVAQVRYGNVHEDVENQLNASAGRTLEKIAMNEIHKQAGARFLPTKMIYKEGESLKIDKNKIPTSISEITAEHTFNYWDVFNIQAYFANNHLLEASSKVTLTMDMATKNEMMTDAYFKDSLWMNGDMSAYNMIDTGKSMGPFTFNIVKKAKQYRAGQTVVELDPTEKGKAAVDIATILVTIDQFGYRLDLNSAMAAGSGPKFYTTTNESTLDDVLKQRFGWGYKFWYGTFVVIPEGVAVYYFAKVFGSGTGGMVKGMLKNILTKTFMPFSVDPNGVAETEFNRLTIELKTTFQEELGRRFPQLELSKFKIGDLILRSTGKALTKDDITKAVVNSADWVDVKITWVNPAQADDFTTFSAKIDFLHFDPNGWETVNPNYPNSGNDVKPDPDPGEETKKF